MNERDKSGPVRLDKYLEELGNSEPALKDPKAVDSIYKSTLKSVCRATRAMATLDELLDRRAWELDLLQALVTTEVQDFKFIEPTSRNLHSTLEIQVNHRWYYLTKRR